MFEGDGAARLVLEFLEAEAFALQLAAERGGGHALFLRQRRLRRPLGVVVVAQAAVDLGGEALVAEADHQPLRRGAQEVLEGRQVLHHRQAQVAGVEADLGAGRIEFRQRAPEQRLGAMRRAGMAEARVVQRDAPSGQPAEHAEDDAEEDFLGAAADRRIVQPGLQADRCPSTADFQAAANVAEEQPEALEKLLQRLAEGRFLDQPAADQGDESAG
ncbi:hypothetical protein D3C76_1295410 [compost metagenome]